MEQQLNVPAPAQPLPEVSQLSREELWAILARGADTSAIAGPLAWQREQRRDDTTDVGQ